MEYSLAAISESELFDPKLLGLKPKATSTACIRGYQAMFSLSASHLVLENLHIGLFALGPITDFKRQQGPEINGVRPTERLNHFDSFNNNYIGLAYHLEYTGGLLLGRGFIEGPYIRLGMRQAWEFEKVVELIFGSGVLQQECDRSEQVAGFRQKVIASAEESDPFGLEATKQFAEFSKREFGLSYRI
jgi:hypothetical protein